MQQINHYTIAKKTGLHSLWLHGFSSIFHARFHRKNERNPVHSFHGLVHSFLRRCWFISQDLRLFRKIFAFFASYSAIIFDGLALGWYSLIPNHAFVDGNKRIGMYVLLSFLETNGIKIRPSNEEVVRVGLATAAGEMKYEDILAWILENK